LVLALHHFPTFIMTTSKFELRMLPIAQLTPAPYNPRRTLKPGDRAWKKLHRSLSEFGLVEPLIWNELTGHIVGGHARLSILKELGVAEVPVSVVRLSAEREKALNVILNNREAQGRFDPDKLAELLTELQDLPELESTGFDMRDLRDLRLEPLEESAVNEDPSTTVQVTLSIPRDRYEEISGQIDSLVSQYDLECHVRGI
jgi:ParB-like chromosome segregation protein Spo0J